MFSYLRQLGQETLVYGLGATIAKFIGFLLVPVYTRIFSPQDYGVIGLISTTMAAVSIFVILSLDAAAGRWYYTQENPGEDGLSEPGAEAKASRQRLLADRKRTIATWAVTQVCVAAIFAVLIYLNAGQLSEWLLGQVEAESYFRYTALWLPFSVLGVVATNWLRFQRRPWATTFFALFSSLSYILLAIWLVVFRQAGLIGVYQAQLLAGILSSLVAALLLGDWINPLRFAWRRLQAMLRFALPLIPGTLAFWVVNFSDRFFVQFYTNTSEVGLYQLGANLASAIALLTTAFQQAWGPFALSIHTRPAARQVYSAVLTAYLVVACLASLALTLLAPEIIGLVATRQYSGASSVIGFLSLSYVLIGLTYIAATGPTIVMRTGPTGIAMFLAAVLNIIFNILLVPRLGRTGSALATMLAQAVVPIYLFYRAQQLYPIPYRFGQALGILGITFGLVILNIFWQPGNAWMSLSFRLGLVLLFVPALFGLRIITLEQVKSLVGNAPEAISSEAEL